MNPEILAAADPHIQSEWHRLKDLNRTVSAALALAVASYRKGVEREQLPGSPPEFDAPLQDWIDYYVGQGVLELHDPLFHPEDLEAAAEAVTGAGAG